MTADIPKIIPILKFGTLCASLAVSPLLAFAKTPFAAMPYTYVGRVLDFRGRTLGEDESITIRISNAAGRLLSKTTTFSSTATPYNYRISVPVATSAADGCVVSGERIVFSVEVKEGNNGATVYRTLLPTGKDVVGAAGGLCRADLTLAEDSDGDGVPNEYVDQISGYMEEAGYLCWDPNADWDGDGMSNRDEYRAGTNPFSPDDCFRLKAAEAAAKAGSECFFAISFFANPGHTYGVKNTETLAADASWIYAPFRREASGTAAEAYFLTADAKAGSSETVYVPKKDAKSGFYKVSVE